MKKYLFHILVLAGLLSSCFKKIDGVDELNTNIFDKEYAGDIWFRIDGAELYTNDLGFLRVRVDAVLEGSKMPELKPSFVDISCSVNGEEETVVKAFIDSNGDFPFSCDAMQVPSGQYCLTAGIYIESEDTTINSFTECTVL